jgi:hypothetical protein
LLDDPVDVFLDSVTERAFDETLMGVLRAEGWTRVRLTHGATEFGKDIIGRRGAEQWAWQSKAGNVGQRAFGQMTSQLDELRLSNYAHPDFDVSAPRRTVLVTTGRLRGNAPLLLREYNERAAARGEPAVEHWGRDILLGKLSGNPDAVLRGSVDGQLLSVLGAVEEHRVSMEDIDRFAQRWTSWDATRLAGLGVIECSLVCERLVARERVDLACHLSLGLLRAALVGATHEHEVLGAAERLFEHYAELLWEQCDDRLLHEKWLVNASGPATPVTYGVRCVRIAELVSLLGLSLEATDPGGAEAIASWLNEFTAVHPAAARVPGDRYAVSLIPTALMLHRRDAAAANRFLRTAAVWICDHYEMGTRGLASHDATPREEIDRLLGDGLESVTLPRRRASQAAAVVIDLCALLESELYPDVVNDVRAVDAYPIAFVSSGDRGVDELLREGASNRWDHNPDYAEQLPSDGGAAAPHLQDEPAPDHRRAWRLLAVSSALRDRHFPAAVRALAQPGTPLEND